MSLLRAALVLFGAVILTTWLVASSRAPTPPPVHRARDVSASRSLASSHRSQIARLRERLATMPDSTGGRRDPFHFVHEARPELRPVATSAQADEVAPAVPERPELQLIGIGEDQRDGGAVRTAIVAGMKQVFLVREGDRVALRFQVKRIGADAIEVEDLAANETFRLALH
jgi:hypothetical protein